MPETATQAHATALTAALETAVGRATVRLARACVREGRLDLALLEEHGALAYDLATISSAVVAARHLTARGAMGEVEAQLALVHATEVVADLRARAAGREQVWGPALDALDGLGGALAAGRDAAMRSALAGHVLATGEAGPRHLPGDLEEVRRIFRRFADERVAPIAQRVHRGDEDVPEEVIEGLARLGGFGLSIPEEHGGSARGSEDELHSMVLVTEELARASLGIAGSMPTRPEIVGTAILQGGTAAQQATWLPAIASGAMMSAVAVTEPGAGSDVAVLRTRARRDGDDWVLDGAKTWCTFAGRAELLLVLARTDPDPSLGHRGLSLFVVEKPAFAGHAWRVEQDGGGVLEGRAIPTLGYRGMHSFEISLAGWRVPHDALVGGDEGLGRGFSLQMQGFANARLQTAGRALGVMQAALEASVAHTRVREVFGRPLADHALTRDKLARMAAWIAACRALAVEVARALARGDADGQLLASQAKQLACRAAEWVAREAQQLHGGDGYAEEHPVSRLFVDARVLSIFEGADEVLALRVVARSLLQRVTEAA